MAGKTNIKKAAFIAELMANGGNQSAAAEKVGWHPQHGRRLASTDPEVRAAIAAAKDSQKNLLKEWTDLAVKAQKKLETLLEARDERVQLLAAKEILERHLGKSTAHVEHSGEISTKVIEEDGVMMAVMTLMGRRGWTLPQAINYVKANPREVQEWMKSLPSGEQPALPAPPPEEIPEGDYYIEGEDEEVLD